jgi:hypothetical protein
MAIVRCDIMSSADSFRAIPASVLAAFWSIWTSTQAPRTRAALNAIGGCQQWSCRAAI